MNITLSMPPQFIDKLKKESDQTGISYSEIVRRALDYYFERQR